jgi:hypothetical protein
MATATAAPGWVHGSKKASELVQPLRLSDAARAELPRHPTALEFRAALEKEGHYRDAIGVTALCLEKRLAVWWGCLCLWNAYETKPSEKEARALQAVVTWVTEPSEQHRRAAEIAAEAAGLDTPTGQLALAVFLSGGSIAPIGSPEVAPAEPLTAKTTALAILLASDRMGPPRNELFQRQCLAVAADVAAGKCRWDRQ